MEVSISNINPKITMDFIKNNTEGQYFDRKSAKIDGKDIAKHLIAFANANGGLLIIGVEDDGRVTGFSGVGMQKLNDFKHIPFEHCKNTPKIVIEEIEIINHKSMKDWILVYHISPSTKRVIRNTADDVFLRIGDKSRKLTHEQINDLEFDKGERYFEEEIIDRSSLKDVDTELLNKYKIAINTRLSDAEVLEGRGLLVNENLTIAGVLLFSKNPSKFYPNARLRFLRYEGIKAQLGQRLNLVKDISIDGPIPNILNLPGLKV